MIGISLDEDILADSDAGPVPGEALAPRLAALLLGAACMLARLGAPADEAPLAAPNES